MRILLCILILTVVASPLSARTWRVEKPGSRNPGDFTVIQDALDAASPGDSVLVGPGRFDDFRLHTFQPSGSQAMVIMTVETTGLTVLGAGQDLTIIGPATHVDEVDGLNPACLVVELGAETTVSGFTFENTRFAVNFRHRSRFAECRVNNVGTNYGLSIIEGDQVEVDDCEFFGPRSITTSSAAVTRPRILNCDFSNPDQTHFAIVIGNGATDAFISHCTISGYGAGIQTSLGGTATIEDCYFTGILVGALDMDTGHMVVRRCLIDAGMRFPIRVSFGPLECYDTLIGGGTMATLLTWGDVYMRNCHLLNGGTLTVDSRGPTSCVVDVRSNWWGTTNLAEIQSWISELNPTVLYEPVLSDPVRTRTRTIGGLKSLYDRQN